jgi:hypothetical protein
LLYSERLRNWIKKIRRNIPRAIFRYVFFGTYHCFIRKPIENEELMTRINEIIIDDVWLGN